MVFVYHVQERTDTAHRDQRQTRRQPPTRDPRESKPGHHLAVATASTFAFNWVRPVTGVTKVTVVRRRSPVVLTNEGPERHARARR